MKLTAREQATICEGCGIDLAAAKAVWTEDGASFCPRCLTPPPHTEKQIVKLSEAQREKVYRTAENAEVECSQSGCRRRDCNGVICRRSVDDAIAAARSLQAKPTSTSTGE